MSSKTLRRLVALVALVAASPLLTACSSPVGPAEDDGIETVTAHKGTSHGAWRPSLR
jgi:hypothetical protein